ncbi:MAG: thioesterase family protein [Nocardioidaceae bacterium]
MPAEVTTAFYRVVDTGEDFEIVQPGQTTVGPWNPRVQHGGPPAALLGRALERLAAASGQPMTVSRFTLDLLGPVPLSPLRVPAAVLRSGRSVDLVTAELVDPAAGRTVAQARAWRVPLRTQGPVTAATEPPPGPEHGVHKEPPPSWRCGYLDSVEWAWIEGAVTTPGPAVMWMRPRIRLVEDEDLSPLQRLLVCVDSASGASSELDAREWGFLNTDLTVHLLRPLTGEWVGLVARTELGGGAAGTALSQVFDRRGLVGHSAQALLIAPR